MDESARRQRDSWTTNAAAWTRAVRDGGIASRRQGTDAAMVAALRALHEPQAADGTRPLSLLLVAGRAEGPD